MNIIDLSHKPMWQLTVEEFLFLWNNANKQESQFTITTNSDKKYVYGIAGIARLFSCSTATANRLKKSGIISESIIQVNRKIIIDADLALELAAKRKWKMK